MLLVNEVTDKMCKQTGRLTSHGYYIFSLNESVGTVAEQSLVTKPRAVILPIVSIFRIAFFILSMSSVRQKKVNNVFVHHKCECTGWCYSKKKQKPTTIKHTIHSKVNNERLQRLRFQGFFYSASLLDYRN